MSRLAHMSADDRAIQMLKQVQRVVENGLRSCFSSSQSATPPQRTPMKGTPMRVAASPSHTASPTRRPGRRAPGTFEGHLDDVRVGLAVRRLSTTSLRDGVVAVETFG
ncbi:hypothetical protein H7H51_17700 [Mycolicibacterium farcinogenes]|nr:hypothetical protein [Mycolicibacterium farcinogenes]